MAMADKPDDSDEWGSGRERREWQRILVDWEVDYGNQDNFLFAYIRDISRTGIFVRTITPEAPGTRLNLRFTPPSGKQLELEGEVIWINKYRPGDSTNLNPGMGIRFIGLTDEQRGELARLIKTFAYLDQDSAPDDDDDSGSTPANDEH
jgi:type IV pilus assembly protein PilZ